MTLSFEEIANGTTPEERAVLAWLLAMRRARETYEGLVGRKCFTYCGDDKCTCEANPTGARDV